MIATTTEAPATRHVSTPLGEVAVPEAQVLFFNEGLIGFSSFKQWVLLGGEAEDTVWLQSVEEPALALLLVDPFVKFEGFALDVPDAAVAALGALQSDELLVFAPVTLGGANAKSTANLRGPILINWKTHRGLQLIVDGGPWGVREEIRG
jgi:flagellar assembly factor FliW